MGPVRGTLKATLTVGEEEGNAPGLELFGPGDVTGLDIRQIVRVYPLPGTLDAETTTFPLVEFDRPDFPWLFTPLAAPPPGDNPHLRRLRPWLALVCVRDTPATRPKREAARPLPVLRVPGHELPDPETGYLWAHAQVLATTESEAEQLLQPEGDPLRSISRLLAPRILYPHTAYIACIVPTFDAGRRAGLGEKGGDLTAAWSKEGTATCPCTSPGASQPGKRAISRRSQPVSRRGRFRRTSASGSSTSAAGPSASIGGPAYGRGRERPSQARARTARRFATPGRSSATVALQAQLADAVGVATDGEEDPVVLPTLYGGFHVLRDKAEPGEPGWFDELNLDPRWRVVAGLGTRAVQREQETLMASAWKQLADKQAANRFLDLARFARLVGRSLHVRHVQPLSADELIQLAAPFQARATRGPMTLRAEIRASALPNGLAALSFRRATRPRGTLSRRIAVASRLAGVQPAGPLFRGTLAAVSLVATGLRAAYRVPDGTIDFRVELDQLPLATERLGRTQQALAEANPGGAPWAELRQIVLERADKRHVDIAVLEARPVPAELEPMLERRLDLATVPEVELAADFFERTKLQADGTVVFPIGTQRLATAVFRATEAEPASRADIVAQVARWNEAMPFEVQLTHEDPSRRAAGRPHRARAGVHGRARPVRSAGCVGGPGSGRRERGPRRRPLHPDRGGWRCGRPAGCLRRRSARYQRDRREADGRRRQAALAPAGGPCPQSRRVRSWGLWTSARLSSPARP